MERRSDQSKGGTPEVGHEPAGRWAEQVDRGSVREGTRGVGEEVMDMIDIHMAIKFSGVQLDKLDEPTHGYHVQTLDLEFAGWRKMHPQLVMTRSLFTF